MYFLVDDSLIMGHKHIEDGCHFADKIFKFISLNENYGIFVWISLRFVPKGPTDD